MIKIKYRNTQFINTVGLLKDAIFRLRETYNNSDNYSSIVVMCDKQMTVELLKDIFMMTSLDEIDLGVNYLDFDSDDYNGDYGFILFIENGQLNVSIEKVRCKNGTYKIFDMDYIYMSDKCISTLLNYLESENIIVFSLKM